MVPWFKECRLVIFCCGFIPGCINYIQHDKYVLMDQVGNIPLNKKLQRKYGRILWEMELVFTREKKSSFHINPMDNLKLKISLCARLAMNFIYPISNCIAQQENIKTSNIGYK